MRMYTSGCPKSQKTCCHKDGIAACFGVVEVRTVEAVDLKLDQGDGQDWQCKDDED